MEKLLDKYLEQNNLTRYKVSKRTGISPTTLQRSSDQEATDINTHVLVAVALATGKTAGKVFDEMINLESENDMNVEEARLLFSQMTESIHDKVFIYTEDMGTDEFNNDKTTIVMEIDLPVSDPIRIAAYKYEGVKLQQDKVVQDMIMALQSFDEMHDDLIYSSIVDKPAVFSLDVENMGIKPEDAEFLNQLGDRIHKMIKF